MIDSPAAAGFAADVVLVVHALFVAFVVFGQAYVLAGWMMGWNSAGNAWFRRLHLAAIAVVVFQAWIGLACPLTTLESGLRQDAGAAAYGQSFVAHWLSRLIYYDFPAWVFVAAYTLFGVLALICYWRFPPRHAHENRHEPTAGP